jgi:hypothetical protein
MCQSGRKVFNFHGMGHGVGGLNDCLKELLIFVSVLRFLF